MRSAWTVAVLLAACATRTPGPGAGSACTGKCDGTGSDSGSDSAPSVCTSDGWCWDYPRSVGDSLNAIAVTPDGDHVVVGSGQTLLASRDGKTWTGSTGAGWQQLAAAWSDSNGRVWAVGSMGTIAERPPGQTAWTLHTTATQQQLTAIYGTAPNDVWALGSGGDALHYDGSAWQLVNLGAGLDLAGLWASASNDVWACGSDLVMHYDGTKWSTVPYNTTGGGGEGVIQFTSIWSDGQALWFTATNANYPVWRYEPSSSSVEPVRDISAWNATSIHGTGPGDIWVLGQYDLLHFDGHAWKSIVAAEGTSPTFTPPFTRDYFAYNKVFAASPSDVWLVGANGRIAHFDGSAWTIVDGSDVLSDVYDLGLVSGVAKTSTATYLVGRFGVLRRDDTTGATNVIDTPPNLDWSPQTVWAVGDDVYRVDRIGQDNFGTIPVPFQVMKVAADGSWQPFGAQIQGSATAAVTAWALDGKTMYVANGSLYRLDGAAWTATNVAAEFVHGTSANNVWAYGGGTLGRFDGTSWKTLQIIAPGSLEQVWGVWTDAPDHGFLGGQGVIYEVKGDTVTKIPFPNHQQVVAFAGTSNDLYAVGGSGYETVSSTSDVWESPYGYILHYDGSTWSWVASGAASPIARIATGPGGDWWAAGGGGILHHQAH